MAKESKFTPNDNDRLIVSALKGTDGLTIAEVNEKLGSSLLPVHFNNAAKGEFIAPLYKREIIKERPSQVGLYGYVNSDVATNDKGEPCNYSDAQNAILAAAAGIDGYFTLAQLAEVMGIEKVAPGSVTSLVNRGNLCKSDEKATVMRPVKSEATVWGYLKDVEQSLDYTGSIC